MLCLIHKEKILKKLCNANSMEPNKNRYLQKSTIESNIPQFKKDNTKEMLLLSIQQL